MLSSTTALPCNWSLQLLQHASTAHHNPYLLQFLTAHILAAPSANWSEMLGRSLNATSCAMQGCDGP